MRKNTLFSTSYRQIEKEQIVKSFGREMIEKGFSLGDIIEMAHLMIKTANKTINSRKPFDLIHSFDIV